MIEKIFGIFIIIVGIFIIIFLPLRFFSEKIIITKCFICECANLEQTKLFLTQLQLFSIAFVFLLIYVLYNVYEKYVK